MAVEIIEQATNQESAVLSLPSVSEASASMLEVVTKGVVEVRSRGRGVGAGIIWDASGQIMTNHHVVMGTGGKPHVLLTDGRRFETTLVAENPALDLALLAVGTKDLPALP